MATFYLDPVGGNDASNGTSFANRWQSLTSGATAARIAAGDTIRIIKSDDATSLGQSASWTDGSQTVTLTSAVTATVLAATAAWTTVTNTTSTTSTNRKLGSTSSSLSVASGFTTGKSHYAATGTIDLSGYQQITFWICQTSGTLASGDGELSLRLCSDTTGDTAVDTFSVPRIRALNQWQAYTINKGSALGSAIQSISLALNNDRGAQTFLINNILAVKAASSADSLSLTSLIGKGTGDEPWFPIQSISGTSVILGTAGPNYNLSASGTPPKYSGTTESVTTYKRQPLVMPSSFVATTVTGISFGTVTDSGSAGSVITFSGGWNATDMSTQTGDTYLSGVNGFGACVYATAKSYVTFEKLNPVNFASGYTLASTTNNFTITARDVSGNANYGIWLDAVTQGSEGPYQNTFTVTNVCCAGNADGFGLYNTYSAHDNTYTFTNLNSNWNHGVMYGSGTSGSSPNGAAQETISATNINRNGTNGVRAYALSNSRFTIGTCANNANAQFVGGSPGTAYPPRMQGCYVKVTSTIIASASSVGIDLEASSNNTFDLTGATISGGAYGIWAYFGCHNNKFIGGSFSSNSTADIRCEGAGAVVCLGTTLSSTTKTQIVDTIGAGSSIIMQKYGGTADDHRHFYGKGTITSDATTRHTASGISWKLAPTSAVLANATYPLTLPVGRVAVGASALVTAKVWVYRSNTGLTTKLVCKGGQIAGVSADVTDSASGSASTWEELEITFTPSEAGVVELEVQTYGGTTYNVYVDDLTVTQA